MHKWHREILQAFDNKLARFFLLNWHRRARKTTLGVNLCIREAVTHSKSVYGYIAPTYRQGKSIVWQDPNMLLSYLPEYYVEDINQSELLVRFKNRSLIKVLGSDDPDSIRGLDFRGVFMDEFPLHKAVVWQEIIRPIMAQDSERWAIFAFTPKGRNHAYDYWKLADRPEFSKEWYKSTLKASKSGIIPQAELHKARLEMSEAMYMQELECCFLDNYAGVFKGHYVEECINGEFISDYIEEVNPKHSYTVGVDLAKYNDYTVIIVICNETKRVVYFNRFNETSWRLQKAHIIEVANYYNDALIYPDSTGVGDPITEDLKNEGCNVYYDSTKHRDGIVLDNKNKEQLIENLVIHIEHRKISFPRIQVMIDELKDYEIEITQSGNKRYNAPEGKHDDCVIALALAVKGLGEDGTLIWTVGGNGNR